MTRVSLSVFVLVIVCWSVIIRDSFSLEGLIRIMGNHYDGAPPGIKIPSFHPQPKRQQIEEKENN